MSIETVLAIVLLVAGLWLARYLWLAAASPAPTAKRDTFDMRGDHSKGNRRLR